MVRAGALKKRYIAFEFNGPELNEEKLKHGLYAEALKFFGEFGLSEAALKLHSYDPKTGMGVIRCERNYVHHVLGFLALISSLNGLDARLVALKSSGTVKSLESVLASTH